MRKGDPDECWPTVPQSFRKDFDKAFEVLKEVAWTCLEDLAKHPFHEDESLRSLFSEEDLKVLRDTVEPMSSISLIHYFQQDSSKAETVHFPSPAHQGDT